MWLNFCIIRGIFYGTQWIQLSALSKINEKINVYWTNFISKISIKAEQLYCTCKEGQGRRGPSGQMDKVNKCTKCTKRQSGVYKTNWINVQIDKCTPCNQIPSYEFMCSRFVLIQSLCVQNPTLMLISPLSSILNSMIPLCEPATARKTGLGSM